MASNFRLLSYRNKDSLHLQLYGDFDGNSAYELINTLKKNGKDFIQIFIKIYFFYRICVTNYQTFCFYSEVENSVQKLCRKFPFHWMINAYYASRKIAILNFR